MCPWRVLLLLSPIIPNCGQSITLCPHSLAFSRFRGHRPCLPVLSVVLIRTAAPVEHEQAGIELPLIESAVKQRDFRCGIDRERVQKGTVSLEQILLLLRGCTLQLASKKRPQYSVDHRLVQQVHQQRMAAQGRHHRQGHPGLLLPPQAIQVIACPK